MLTIIIPIQKRRIAAVCKAVGVDLIQKEPLFPHSPPAAKADQNDHKKRDRPFFLFYFLHSFCFSSFFCPFCSQIWLCFSSISYLEHKSKLFGLQIPLLLAACTLLDIPTGWDPRAKQSHTMALFAVLRTAALFKSRAETKKNQYTNVYWFFLVGAAGFEPTASSSRTRRATNCAMPRKYRNPMGCGLVGDERIELPQVESESTALPLCKSPISCCVSRH